MPRSFLVRKPSDPRRKPNYSELQDACVGAWRGAGWERLGPGAGGGGGNLEGAAGTIGLCGRDRWIWSSGAWQLVVRRGRPWPGTGRLGSPSVDSKAGGLVESGWGRGGSPGSPHTHRRPEDRLS